MIPYWPATLPQAGAVNVTGNPQPNTITFSPEVGPPISRRRASNIAKIRNVEFSVLSREQYLTFLNFFENTLKDGTLPFYWVDPMSDNSPILGPSTINWTAANMVDSTANWYQIAYSPKLGMFVAVASSGANRLAYSYDGRTWIFGVTLMPYIVYRNICWSQELSIFVAIGSAGTGVQLVATSPDGINWTVRNASVANQWFSIVWASALNLFVACAISGTNNRVMTSPDGINWTTRTSSQDNLWNDITWSPDLNLFVACASSGTNRIMTSPDGINWTNRTIGLFAWNSVAWSPTLKLFVAINSNNTGNNIATSPDGINWTNRKTPNSNAAGWFRVIWCEGINMFVACAFNGVETRMIASRDGINWFFTLPLPYSRGWYGLVYSPEMRLIVAVATSAEGSDFKIATGPDFFPRKLCQIVHSQNEPPYQEQRLPNQQYKINFTIQVKR